ncbi:hypothetical protein MYCO108962_20725 [Mycobacterium colombiense]
MRNHRAARRILRVSDRCGRGREQRRMCRCQRRAPGQSELRLLRCAQHQGTGRLQLLSDRGDVDAVAADHEQAVWPVFHRRGVSGHRGQRGQRLVFVLGEFLPTHIGDRTVRGVHHSHRRGGRLNEQQRGLRVPGRVAHRLRQRGRRQKCRDQHDFLELLAGQQLFQGGGLGGIGPRHADRSQLATGFGRRLPRSQDCRDHLMGRRLICPILSWGHFELVRVDRGTVGVFPFDHDHMDRRGRHRHTEYGFHRPSHMA